MFGIEDFLGFWDAFVDKTLVNLQFMLQYVALLKQI